MNIPTSINSDLVYQTENMYNFINKPLSNSFIIFIFFIVILIYIAMSLSLGKQPSLEALSSGNLNIEMSADTWRVFCSKYCEMEYYGFERTNVLSLKY